MATDFDAAARTWDSPEKIARSARIAEAIAEALPLHPTWSGLEFGCGTGQLTWQLGERVGHVTLADVSEGMLAVAREHAALDSDRYRVVNHDLSKAPLPYAVDLAYSAMALHHIPDTGALLRNVALTVKPWGWVALADLDPDPANHFHDDDFDGHRGVDRHAIVAALQELGFSDVRERTAARIAKEKDGRRHEFDVFLVTGRRRA